VSRNLSFAFTAVTATGALESGVVEATSREAAAALIGGRGGFPISVTPRTSRWLGTAAISAQDLALGLRSLATLIGAGIPLSRAFAVLDELAPPALKGALPDLRHRVEQGEPLAAALEASSLPFPAFVIGIIRAGEAGSGLAAGVERAAELLESQAAMRSALRNALAYPTMLAIGGGASVSLLIGVVLPRFAALLADYGQSLPFTTRLVLGLGLFARAALIPGLVLLAAGFVLWRRWVAEPSGAARWHAMLLAAPVLGPIRRSTAAAGACATLGALLEAGVPLPDALPHSGAATGDRAVAAALLAAQRRIETGDRISSALQITGTLTPTVIRLVRLGEETGRLPQMLVHAARIEAQQAQQLLQRAIRLIEPLLIVVFGGIVMIVAAALLQAMYGLRPIH